MNVDERRLERERLLVVIATIAINVAAVSLLTFAPWSDWRTGAALNFVDNCLLVGFALVRCDALLGRFHTFEHRNAQNHEPVNNEQSLAEARVKS